MYYMIASYDFMSCVYGVGQARMVSAVKMWRDVRKSDDRHIILCAKIYL
jgi:hypothetical protein